MDDDEDYGPCEIAGCGADAEHVVQVHRDGEAFGPPLALCDRHVVPYMACGSDGCEEQATEVAIYVRENLATGDDDRRRIYACDDHAAALADPGAQVEIDGLVYRRVEPGP